MPLAVVLAGGDAKWPLRATDIVQPVRLMAQRGHSRPGLLPTLAGHSRVQLRLFLVADIDGWLLTEVDTELPPVLAMDVGCRQAIPLVLARFFRVRHCPSQPACLSIGK